MRCMEMELSGCVGGDIRKMTAQLMVWSGAALMDYGGKSGKGEKGERKAWGGRRVGAEGGRQRNLETLLVVDFFRYVSD